MESAHDAAEREGDQAARWIAVLIAALAASLALAELGEKSTQNTYLTDHVTLSDNWAYYQAKNVRATARDAEATILERLPGAADPAMQARIKQARDQAVLLRGQPQGGQWDEQLEAGAAEIQAERDHAFHHYHWYELLRWGACKSRLCWPRCRWSLRARALTLAAGLIGGGAALLALAVVFDLV